jgi:hypothetical protein
MFGSGVINEVMATMVLWNSVSPVYPYLDDVRSRVDEGPLKVCFVRFVIFFKSWQLVSWLAFDSMISTSSFGLFYRKVRNLQHSILTVKDGKHVLLRGFL